MFTIVGRRLPILTMTTGRQHADSSSEDDTTTPGQSRAVKWRGKGILTCNWLHVATTRSPPAVVGGGWGAEGWLSLLLTSPPAVWEALATSCCTSSGDVEIHALAPSPAAASHAAVLVTVMPVSLVGSPSWPGLLLTVSPTKASLPPSCGASPSATSQHSSSIYRRPFTWRLMSSAQCKWQQLTCQQSHRNANGERIKHTY